MRGTLGGAGSSVERRAALPGAPVQLEARRIVSAGLAVVALVCVCVWRSVTCWVSPYHLAAAYFIHRSASDFRQR
jgi:hypothetical protein